MLTAKELSDLKQFNKLIAGNLNALEGLDIDTAKPSEITKKIDTFLTENTDFQVLSAEKTESFYGMLTDLTTALSETVDVNKDKVNESFVMEFALDNLQKYSAPIAELKEKIAPVIKQEKKEEPEPEKKPESNKELSEVKQLNKIITSNVNALDSLENKEQLLEKGKKLDDFLVNMNGDPDNLPVKEKMSLYELLSDYTDSLKNTVAMENGKEKTDFAAAFALDNISDSTKILTDLKEKLRPKEAEISAEPVKEEKNEKKEPEKQEVKVDFSEPISQINRKLDDITGVHKLSPKQRKSVRNIKNDLRDIRDKLEAYFGKDGDRSEFTSEAQKELTEKVEDLAKRMDNASASGSIEKKLKAPQLLNADFLRDIAVKLKKVVPAIEKGKLDKDKAEEKLVDEIADEKKAPEAKNNEPEVKNDEPEAANKAAEQEKKEPEAVKTEPTAEQKPVQPVAEPPKKEEISVDLKAEANKMIRSFMAVGAMENLDEENTKKHNKNISDLLVLSDQIKEFDGKKKPTAQEIQSLRDAVGTVSKNIKEFADNNPNLSQEKKKSFDDLQNNFNEILNGINIRESTLNKENEPKPESVKQQEPKIDNISAQPTKQTARKDPDAAEEIDPMKVALALKRIKDHDGSLVYSSQEHRKATQAITKLLTYMKDNIDPDTKKLRTNMKTEEKAELNFLIRDALNRAEVYVEKKGKERNGSDLAVQRFRDMRNAAKVLRGQLEVSDRQFNKKVTTNDTVANKLIEQSKARLQKPLSKVEKMDLLATMQCIEALKMDPNGRFNINKLETMRKDNLKKIFDAVNKGQKIETTLDFSKEHFERTRVEKKETLQISL